VANSPYSSQTVGIRIASTSDTEALVHLINAAFIVERVAFDGDRVNLEGVGVLIRKGTFLVAQIAGSGDPVACVYLEPRTDRCYLGLLSVAPEHQGQGLARAVETAAAQFARDAGFRAIDLRVISPRAEALVPLYTRLGYIETGTAELAADVPAKVPCRYVLMTKSLR